MTEDHMNIFRQVESQIVEKYFANKEDARRDASLESNLLGPILDLLEETNGEIKGKRILDLGCGSVSYDIDTSFDNHMNTYGHGQKRTFEPWFCRGLLLLGAEPIGVDIGSLEGEEFEHYGGCNLLSSNSLGMLADNSIDIVHVRLLFSSPQLERMDRRGPERLKTVLMPQIDRAIKPNGVRIIDYSN